MKSMTGFGRGEHVSRGIRVSVEISTVNRRHAELVFNLPREFASMEAVLRDVVGPAVSRGRATLTAAVSAASGTRTFVDAGLLRRAHAELVAAQKSLGIPGQPSLSDVIRLYAASAPQQNSGPGPDTAALVKAAREAVRALQVMRAKEGANLARELERLLRRLTAEVAAIGKLAPRVVRKHHATLRSRLAALEPGLASDDERLARELAIFADRSDITEELSRLDSHIGQFRAALASDAAGGRSLDFLAQEMFRECNTIGSKANDAAVTRRVIAAKTELERLREQVQNVE
jgi:uncharacterized protein (TIGR00255 family)